MMPDKSSLDRSHSLAQYKVRDILPRRACIEFRPSALKTASPWNQLHPYLGWRVAQAAVMLLCIAKASW
jgi:hypothetical protein